MSLEHVKDTEMKARIHGVSAQMKKFDFFFGVSLGLLRHSDNLSKTMQKTDMSAAECQATTAMTIATLKSLRTDENFDLFWNKVATSAECFDISKPAFPRHRKIPRRLDDGSMPTLHETVEIHYRIIYFEALDLITSCIEDRYNQPGFKTYEKVQTLLLKAAFKESYDEEMQFVLYFYGSDFDPLLLPTHLELLSQHFFKEHEVNGVVVVSSILRYSSSSTPSQLELMSEVCKLVKLLYVMPATNAESERSFSTVRRIKSYLRSTMSQQRLNHLMLLNIHKSFTDKLNLVDVANDFIAGNEHRKNVFGIEFKVSDLDS